MPKITKVTDALIKYYREYVDGKDVTTSQEWIINRYQAMVDELGFSANSMKKLLSKYHFSCQLTN